MSDTPKPEATTPSTPPPTTVPPPSTDTVATEAPMPPPYRQPNYRQPTTGDDKRWLWLALVMLAVLFVGVMIGRWMGSSTPEMTSTSTTNAAVLSDGEGQTEQAVMTVETVSPGQTEVNRTLSADGTIQPKDIAQVSGKVSGFAIEQVLVQTGQRVERGQVLAVFDTQAMGQQLLQAEAQLVEAEAALINASANLERVLPLLEIDAISRQEVDRYQTGKTQAEASVRAAQAGVNTQRIQLNNSQVVAPVAGIISERNAEVGSVSGGEPLFTIIVDGKLEWQAQVNPSQATGIQTGTPVRVKLPNNQTVSGIVERVAPTAGNNRQVSIYASLEPSSAVRSGMYLSGELLLGSEAKQVLPVSAIVSTDGYDYVMLVQPVPADKAQASPAQSDNTVMGRIERQRVTLGERIGEQVVIGEPLPTQARIVAQGAGFLNHGDLVRVVLSAQSQGSSSTQPTLPTGAGVMAPQGGVQSTPQGGAQ